MSRKSNIHSILNSIPKNVSLIAVSKTKPDSAILEAYNAGQRIFGENKIQEMVEKHEVLPKDIEWHMIGHLQSNKVKYMAPFVSLIHGVDGLKKLEEINKQAIKNNRIIDCLLQIKIATEETKFGLSIEDSNKLLESDEFKKLTHIHIKGFMGMASFTNDETIVKNEFRILKKYLNSTKNYELTNFTPSILSMGMSGDYKIAIEEGSNMIRVGSSIFGERNYI